jgi:hypothetical protein
MKREFERLMREESESRPDARVHLYCGYGVPAPDLPGAVQRVAEVKRG